MKKRKLFCLLAGLSICGFSANAQMPGPNIGDLGSVTFTYDGQQVTYTTVRAGDSNIWLQQNLGSSQVATAMNDAASYGDLFQWGRWDDGHQLRTSQGVLTTTLNVNNPSGLGTGDPNFYYGSPAWWSDDSSRRTDTWSADPPSVTNGHSPCSDIGLGWRVPDSAMWAKVRVAENMATNAASGYNTRLKLPAAGYRNPTNASQLQSVGNASLYMVNSLVNDVTPWYIYNSALASYWVNRGFAGSVRCIYIPLCEGTPSGGNINTTKHSVCNGGSFALSLTGASELTNIEYQWQERPVGTPQFTDVPGATKTYLNVTNFQQTTEYRVKVLCTSSMDSAYSDTLAVAILSLPIDLGEDTVLCDGDTLTLDAGVGGTDYEWSNGANSRTIKVSDPDKYWARISNNEGCIGTDTVKVSILGKPYATTINATAYGLTYAFSVDDALNATEYDWQFGDGQSANTAAPIHTYTETGDYNVTVQLRNECDSTSISKKITVENQTGIEEPIKDGSIKIYPNPATGFLNIATANLHKAELGIFDIAGKEIIHLRLSSNETIKIPVSNWAAGIYLIRIVSDQGVSLRKLVVE